MRLHKRRISVILILCLLTTAFIIPINTVNAATISEENFAGKISQLRKIYRDKEYWNGYNDCGYDGTGSKKCGCSVSCSSSCSDKCGKFYYNNSYVGGQCYGFANKMAYLVFNSVPELHWTKYTSVDNYYAGDYVRVRNNRHSIFITKVSGDTITYVDCNNYGPCQIKWDRTISKSSLSSITTYVRHMSGNNLKGVGNSSSDTPIYDVKWVADSNYPTPITAYPAASSGKISVYNSNLTEYSQSTRYIAYNDLCTINTVYTNGYCSVTYPTSNGTHTEYAKTLDFIPNGVTPYSWSPKNNVTAYIRSDMSTTFGSVFSSDLCKVVGKSGDTKLQVIYPVSGGYKLGWVVDNIPQRTSDFPTPIKGYTASSNVRTTVYESLNSMGTYYGQIFVDDQCTLNTVNVKDGWIYVTYPVGNSSKSGYVYLNDFVPTNSKLTTFYNTTVTQKSDTFRKPDMTTNYGWVNAGDQITVVGKSGNKLQILYPLDAQYGGGYKIAWMYDKYIKKNIKDIFVASNPQKTEYLEGEKLNTSGLVIKANYDDGSTSSVDINYCSVSGYTETPGAKTVTVSYDGKQTAFTVIVKGKSPTSLKIKSMPNKLVYKIGEKINTEGLTADIAFDNGTTVNTSDLDVIYDDNITDFAGEKEITVSYVYNEISVESQFSITVKSSEIIKPDNPSEKTDKPEFNISNIRCKSGEKISVDVSIKNNPSITSFKLKINYPSDILTLTNVEYRTLFSSKATGMNRLVNPFIISWFSSKSENENSNGVIATLNFQVSENADDGTYPISVTYDPDDVFDSEFNNINFTTVDGSVTVVNILVGDVNGDGKVNMKDIVLLQQFLNDWNVTIDEKASDANADGRINMKDIVLLQQYLNGWNVILK